MKEVEGPIFDVPLVALLRVWKDNPEQFFTGWKLDTAGSAVCYDINPSAPGNSTLFCEKVSQMRMLIHKKQEYSIRYIFHTLFFRDLLNGKTDDEGLLARGKAYNEACLKLCLRFLSPEASDELVGEIRNWVKEGQVFHLVGRALGCGALLLLANSITQDK